MMKQLLIILLLIVCVGCMESTVDPPMQNAVSPTDAPTDVPVTVLMMIEAAYITLDGIIDVVWVQVMGDSEAGWLVSAEIVVSDRANTILLASELHQAAMAVLVSAKVDFTAVLSDSSHSVDYSRWVVNDAWIVTELDDG